MKTKTLLYSFILFFFILNYIVLGCEKKQNDSIEYQRNSVKEGWEAYIVDDNKQVGYYCAVKTEIDGKAHVAYLDRTNENLKYAFGID